MTNENPIRFTLTDNTNVIVKKVTNNKYDFELIFSNGSRRTFMWTYGTTVDLKNGKGKRDVLMIEAVNKFFTIQK
ncbi:MAG TPA: hypothetical protein VFW07_27510 [Parafilimonas sp.]|nr:hypothetical protein [Parafilimonas sp.]